MYGLCNGRKYWFKGTDGIYRYRKPCKPGQRLQSEAEADQILVNQRTFSMVKDNFETEIIPDITLKEINKSVVAYKILGI